MAKKILKTGFPEGFYWGASTSAHQVEGGNTNDWSVWERENSARLAKEALSKSYPGHVLNDYPGPLRRENYVSGASVDHYGRYEEDFNIAITPTVFQLSGQELNRKRGSSANER